MGNTVLSCDIDSSLCDLIKVIIFTEFSCLFHLFLFVKPKLGHDFHDM